MSKINEKKEIKNKNTEVAGQEGNMNIIKKTVLGISNYFRENYRTNKFRKFVSLFVVLCFVINIANLPVYAAKEKKARDNKETNERVIKTGKTDASDERVQKVFGGDVLAELELIQEAKPKVSVDKLISAARDYMPTALMNLANIHAIAAAA